MKLAIAVGRAESPSSFYRAMGPMTALSREYGIELIVDNKDWFWPKMLMVDAFFMHCPVSPTHVELAELCKATKTPLWIDFDDHMNALGRDNAGYNSIMTESAQRAIARCVKLADVITVSTPYLAENLFKGARVIPNAFDDYMWDFNPSPRTKTVVWRGGPAHLSDSEKFIPVCAQAAKDFPDWEFHFIGYPHWSVDELMPEGSCVTHGWTDIIDYYEILNQIQPSIMYAPMQETPFNLAKSNCVWLEATGAGAALVGPNWPEFCRPGIAAGGILSKLMTNADLRANLVRESREFISKNLLLSQVNKQRLAVLTELAGKRRKANYGIL